MALRSIHLEIGCNVRLARSLILFLGLTFLAGCFGDKPIRTLKNNNRSSEQADATSSDESPGSGTIEGLPDNPESHAQGGTQGNNPIVHDILTRETYKWTSAVTLYDPNEFGFEALAHVVATNDRGQIVVVSRLRGLGADEGRSYIAASMSQDGRSWSDDFRIDDGESEATIPNPETSIAASMGTDGSVVALWNRKAEDGSLALYLSFYEAHSAKWQIPKLVANAGGVHFDVGFDQSSGKYTIAYSQRNKSFDVSLFTTSFDPKAGALAPLVSLDSGDFSEDVLMDLQVKAGRGALVFKRNFINATANDQRYQFLICFYRDGVWSAPEVVAGDGAVGNRVQSDGAFGNHTDDTRLALSAKGEVLVVWDREIIQGTQGQVFIEAWAALYAADNKVMFNQRLTGDAVSGRLPRATFNAEGAAIVIWQQVARIGDRALQVDLISAVLSPGGEALQSMGNVLPDNSGSQFYPDLQASANGDFALVFTQIDNGGNADVFRVKSVRFYKEHQKWGKALLISDDKFTRDANFPAIFPIREGQFGVIWRQLFDSGGKEQRALLEAVSLPN